MATLSDIDVNGLVQKYLSRTTESSSSDSSNNKGEEVQALLESVATTLLLYPRAALALILLAKNSLQQLVTADIELVDAMTQAIDDLNNPNTPVEDASDLVEAQTALIELTRLGRLGTDVQAYTRYNNAVNRFLKDQLAKSLKRHGRLRNGEPEFERSGLEARQDILQASAMFEASHPAVITRLAELQASVSDFQGVDLTKMVSSKTVTRVRSSLRQILNGAKNRSLSKTVMALELLSGSAALKSVSSYRGLLDPLVDSSADLPDGKVILADADQVAATAVSTDGPWTLTGSPWNFTLAVNGGSPTSIELPSTGATGKVFVASSPGAATYDTSAIKTLYLRLDGGTPSELAIVLTSGAAVPFATLVSDINTALGANGTCQELFAGSNRFIIFGASAITRITVLSSVPGTVGGMGVYTPAAPSAHSILGFTGDLPSAAVGVFDANTLKDILDGQVGTVLFTVEENSRLRLTSTDSSLTSSLVLSDVATVLLGFSAASYSQPTKLSLFEGTTAVSPADLGILVGAQVEVTETSGAGGARSFKAPVTSISGDSLLFGVSDLPRGTGLSVKVTAASTLTVTSLLYQLQSLPSLSDDLFSLQKVLSPLIGSPTQAQMGDARRALATIKSHLTSSSPDGLLEVLQAWVVRPDQLNDSDKATAILGSLEDRGLDRATDLLKQGLFSQFFALTREDASNAGWLMNAIEKVGRNDIPSTTIDADIPDGKASGVGPTNTLQSKETT